mgnify:CR=1 FL=1
MSLERSRIWASLSSKEAVAETKPMRLSSFMDWELKTGRPKSPRRAKP